MNPSPPESAAAAGDRAGRDPEPGASTSVALARPALSLEGVSLAMVDRWLPARPKPFLATVTAIAVACWLCGFALAADRMRFLANRDWQMQPLYFATHFVVLRLFITAYSRNFMSGARKLVIDPAVAERRVMTVLGPLGWLAAFALAAPFVYYDLVWFLGPEFLEDESQGGGALGATDWLLAGTWTLEWVINAYVWVVILGFLGLTMRLLKKHPFKAELDVVLGERHYRSFLIMSAQGASIVLGFSIVSAIYVWHAEGEATDYLALWITAGLLMVGFVPPWLRLKNGLARSARTEADRINREVRDGWRVIAEGDGVGAETPAGLASRLNLLISMARAGHLERLYRDLGRSEGQAMLIRILAPLSTVVWKLFRPG